MSTNRRQFKSSSAGEGYEAARDERRDGSGHCAAVSCCNGSGQNFVDARDAGTTTAYDDSGTAS
jgi:hypothetical protein